MTTGPWVVFYARLALDRHTRDGAYVRLLGDTVYLGGLPVWSFAAAEALARDTVNAHAESARGTVLPRVFRFRPGETVLDVGYRVQEWFEARLADMNEAAATTAHTDRLF